MTEIDWAKVEEYQKNLEEYEEEKHRKRIQPFNPDALLQKASKVYTLETDDYGTIKYGMITQKEWLRLHKIEDKNEQTLQILFETLKKGNPDIKLDEIRQWPFIDVANILKLLFGEGSLFFQMTKKSMNGLKTPTTFKGSDT